MSDAEFSAECRKAPESERQLIETQLHRALSVAAYELSEGHALTTLVAQVVDDPAHGPQPQMLQCTAILPKHAPLMLKWLKAMTAQVEKLIAEGSA